ncbi:osmotically inducible protein OsmC [Cellvibrio zantedeschiae]|uniref:Osmotically inducible protein OsmC n=1 Tax=Cellvibrio zantedeschiae TaxID=1237077 RepID=A0ABQ3APM1_9GAMM|nr:OsmC family protein [Cellvibrio zantedeschiae]GGY62064.1 osmotically inducible protein OsmC [Cellvibrio zantedeschiae]
MQRSANAEWIGNLKQGKGKISTQSGALRDAQYGFNTRFEDGPGTNPEELIGAAHAGCFSMALSLALTEAGLTVDTIKTTATITLEKQESGFTITASHLDLTAKIPGADNTKFLEIANKAKEGCPVSKLLNAKITLDAKLES